MMPEDTYPFNLTIIETSNKGLHIYSETCDSQEKAQWLWEEWRESLEETAQRFPGYTFSVIIDKCYWPEEVSISQEIKK